MFVDILVKQDKDEKLIMNLNDLFKYLEEHQKNGDVRGIVRCTKTRDEVSAFCISSKDDE